MTETEKEANGIVLVKRLLVLFGIVVMIILLLGVGMAGGVVLERQVLTKYVPVDEVPPEDVSSFQLMAEAWNTIRQSYVDRPAILTQTLTYGAIGGMVDALGDTGHSRFLSPEMVREQHDFTSGQFEGIGAYVEMIKGQVVIVAPMDGSPAQQAGLHPGDVILKVDGENMTGLPTAQVVSRILGPTGTSVTLTILTPETEQTRDVTLVRAQITLQNVSWRRLPGTQIAHLRITAFGQGVTEDLKQALGEIQQQGMTASSWTCAATRVGC